VIATTCIAIVRSHLFAANPDVIAWGVTLDLTFTIPLLYWIVLIRSGMARPITIVPVFAIGATVAAILLPRGDQALLHSLRYVVAPLEIVTIVLLVRRLVAMRRRESTGDPLARIRTAAEAALGNGVMAGLVATEIAVVWYAIFGWRRDADAPAASRPFTVHQRSGWGSVLACILVLVASESIAVHLFVQMWSARAAWIVTSLDVYGLLWLIGDYNALRLRPSLVRGNTLEIRYGLRWTATIERANVIAMRDAGDEADWKRPGVLKVAMIDAPRFIIELREPVIANGLAGMRKSVGAIAISPDDEGPLREFLG
jgi:hypothetical protein